MGKEISLKDLLETTFTINDNGEMVGEFTLKRINMIGDILTQQYKEIERLKEELKELKEIIEIGRKRKYHSKFLKDFQKERGKNVFPDHDEIYKRYDDYKSKVEKAIDLYENDDYSTLADDMYKILKGVDKE